MQQRAQTMQPARVRGRVAATSLLIVAASVTGCVERGRGAPPESPPWYAASPGGQSASPPSPGVEHRAPTDRGEAHTPGGSVALAAPERGRATYYADSLAGNRTASGDRYDPSQPTAAHRTLPFGTVVEVARADGRWVRVRINDRGPFAGEDRIIDLSRSAAEQLGMIREGVIDVRVWIVERPAPKR